MHALLLAFFATLFSFCHASATQNAIDTPEVKAGDEIVFVESDSSNLQRTAVYAGEECTSCRMTNVTYVAR